MTVHIDVARTIATINPALHGHFVEFLGECIDGGIWVGPESTVPNTGGVRTAVLEALRELEPPIIRFPGGCYADTYHWRDGIGPREQRPTTFNENFGTFELDDHGFGTDEFLQLCETVGAEAWLNVNTMSGSVAEMRDWMEYVNREQGTSLAAERAANGHAAPYDVRRWGIGNEPWAGGGTMTAQGYAELYRAYASAMPRFTAGILEPSRVLPIAAGPDGNKPLERVRWTQDFFAALAEYRVPPLGGYDLHFYNWNIGHDGDTSETFEREGWDRLIAGSLELEEVILEQHRLVREGLTALPAPESDFFTAEPTIDLVVGEWGNWHGDAFAARPALRQQVTMRDAITTALTLDVLQRNADKVSMACNAQLVNVLNALLLTEGEHTVRTANFDVFMMYKAHRGAQALEVSGAPDGVHVFASLSEDGALTIDLVNADLDGARKVELSFAVPTELLEIETLAADEPTACNTVERPDAIRRSVSRLDRAAATAHGVTLPAGSVSVLRARAVGA